MTADSPSPVLTWFTTAGPALGLFYAIGIVAALALLLQIGLMVLGFGDGHDLDAASHADGEAGFFSLRGIVAFFVGFGWTGVIATKAGLGVAAATGVALAAGLAFMAAIYGIVRLLYAQRSSGNVRLDNAVGRTGRVYLGIPAASAPGGQIQITFQGRHQTLPAITAGAAPIPTGATVVVRAVVPPDTLIVEKA